MHFREVGSSWASAHPTPGTTFSAVMFKREAALCEPLVGLGLPSLRSILLKGELPRLGGPHWTRADSCPEKSLLGSSSLETSG